METFHAKNIEDAIFQRREKEVPLIWRFLLIVLRLVKICVLCGSSAQVPIFGWESPKFGDTVLRQTLPEFLVNVSWHHLPQAPLTSNVKSLHTVY